MDRYQKKFIAIYDNHSDEIFRYLYYRLRNRDQALDLTQEIFSRFWVYLSSGREIENPRAFLYRSAHNAFVNAIRDKKAVYSLDELSEQGLEVAYTEDDKEELEIQKEAVEKLKEVDESYREVLILRYVSGLKVKEIAELLEETENNISVRIYRGLKKLKKIYEQD